MSSDEKIKQRGIIQFCVGRSNNGDVKNRSTKTPSVAQSLVCKWHNQYSGGRETIMDDDRCGRPVSKSKTSDVKSRRVILRYSLN